MTALDPRLLEILVCPICKGALVQSADGAELACPKCPRSFPVRDGIPDLIVDEERSAKLLFVCVENSCRSQMAEGFARALGGRSVEAYSAGSRPSGKVDETAVKLMKEKDVDLAGQSSKGLSDLPTHEWDFVVTMGCGDACPSVSAKKRADWDLRDPKSLPVEGFREVRDEIERRVRALLLELR